MDAATDCEAPSAFYMAEEGGEFLNASISGKREEGTSFISNGERSTRDDSLFPRGGATGGCSSATSCGDG
jgi:hypothetical protein